MRSSSVSAYGLAVSSSYWMTATVGPAAFARGTTAAVAGQSGATRTKVSVIGFMRVFLRLRRMAETETVAVGVLAQEEHAILLPLVLVDVDVAEVPTFPFELGVKRFDILD